MPSAIVIGGGLAGLAAAAALGDAGFEVGLYESRGFLGGRATSYPLPGDGAADTIDNCQHILLRCCVNLLDFYRRMGVGSDIRFYKEFFFLEPGGRMSIFRRGLLPPPAHFAGSFLGLKFLGLADKIGIGRAMLAVEREYKRRRDLDRISMLDWLREQRQTPLAISRFWNQILVSAINEELDRMAAIHGFQVVRLGFLASSDAYQMGVPSVPLAQLYGSNHWDRIGNVKRHMRSPVDRVEIENGRVSGIVTRGERLTADYYVSCLPFEKLAGVVPGYETDLSGFEHSPITGIHLWFNRPVTSMPHAALLDRTIQWMFNKSDGRYVQLVVSASRSLVNLSKAEVVDLALKELAEFFPEAARAQLEKAHVVKEVRATFSAAPGLESKRPVNRTSIPNFFLSGDWTRSGWPATMEGAVRSGYLAAEAVTEAAGSKRKFLLPDIA